MRECLYCQKLALQEDFPYPSSVCLMREHKAPKKLAQTVQATFGTQDDVFTAVSGKASPFVSCHVDDVVVVKWSDTAHIIGKTVFYAKSRARAGHASQCGRNCLKCICMIVLATTTWFLCRMLSIRAFMLCEMRLRSSCLPGLCEHDSAPKSRIAKNMRACDMYYIYRTHNCISSQKDHNHCRARCSQ